ncbi:MAG: aminotransferase class V-fold PLP-dependent enzyme [Candidatus Poribacteria bacterium]|nr:aminotransferase class V-fold PLP-dependent enzyme [Candidatus Poribacteria bacterium]
MSQTDLSALRGEFPLTQEYAYLNTGTAGLCPVSVAEATWESIKAFDYFGLVGWGPAAERMNAGRERLAAFLGVAHGEITFTRNASDGVNLVVQGVSWQDGDEVLLSNEEHPSMLHPWTFLTQRNPITLNRFTVARTAEETLANVQAAITPKTRLVATSHVSSLTGARVPVIEIARLCRERGILSMIDGAQAVGQFPINLSNIRADFYTGNLHKWLHGPKGTGFLYVAKERQDELTATWIGADSGRYEDGRYLPHDSALRYEYGTRDFGKYGSIVPLMDWFERVGFDTIWAHQERLTAKLKCQLDGLDGVIPHSPGAWEESSALTTFSVKGVSAERVFRGLWDDHRIVLRIVPEIDANRVSTALFNTDDEIDRLIDSLKPYLSA